MVIISKQAIDEGSRDIVHLVPGLVSIIVPCFNVEKYIEQFLDSILDQTYGHLELILVNDGSTDDTRLIIEEYLSRLRSKCVRVAIIDQQNRGLAGAVDSGLKHFSGEFLTWPDPDDWLPPHSIERRVQLLRDHPDAALLRANAKIFIEAQNRWGGRIGNFSSPIEQPENLFHSLFFSRTFFGSTFTMVRSIRFLEANGRSIYVGRNSSQNMQMMLPLLQRFQSLVVDEELAYYRQREDSRSRAAKTPEALRQRNLMLHQILQNVIKRLEGDRHKLSWLCDQYYIRNRLLPVSFQGGAIREVFTDARKVGLPFWRSVLAAGVTAYGRVFFGRRVDIEVTGEGASIIDKIFQKLVHFDVRNVQLSRPSNREISSNVLTAVEPNSSNPRRGVH